jgi:hypothetical protein
MPSSIVSRISRALGMKHLEIDFDASLTKPFFRPCQHLPPPLFLSVKLACELATSSQGRSKRQPCNIVILDLVYRNKLLGTGLAPQEALDIPAPALWRRLVSEVCAGLTTFLGSDGRVHGFIANARESGPRSTRLAENKPHE